MFHENWLTLTQNMLIQDFLRYALGAGGVYLAINILFAARLRPRKIRDKSPDWVQMRREILVSMRTVLVFAGNGLLITYGALAGYLPIYDDIGLYGQAYLWGTLIGLILVQDTWFYWSHWLMHRPVLFRIFHRTHHKSYNPSPFSSYAFDFGESVAHAMILPIFLFFVPMHPLAIILFAAHMMLRNALGHCGYELFPANRHGQPLIGWLTTVTHHDLHHANARYNLGLYFTWWDRWMGTEHPDYLTEFSRVSQRETSKDRSRGRVNLS